MHKILLLKSKVKSMFFEFVFVLLGFLMFAQGAFGVKIVLVMPLDDQKREITIYSQTQW